MDNQAVRTITTSDACCVEVGELPLDTGVEDSSFLWMLLVTFLNYCYRF